MKVRMFNVKDKRSISPSSKKKCQLQKASYCKVLLDDEEVVERLVDRLVVVVLDGPQVRFDQRQLLHLHKQSGNKMLLKTFYQISPFVVRVTERNHHQPC